MASIASLIANYNPSTYAANQRVAEEQARQAPIATALGQQQLQDAELKTKLQQRQLQDQDIIQRAMASTDGSVPAMRKYLVQNGISGPGYLDWQANMAALQKNYAGIQGTELDNASKIHQQVGNILQAYQGLPPDQRAAAWAQTRAQIAALEPGASVPEQAPDDATLQYYLTGHGMLGTILNQQKTKAGIAQTEAATAASQAAARKAAAETPGAAAESSMKQRQAAGMQNATPASDAAAVDAVVPPDKYPKENKELKGRIVNARNFGLSNTAIQAEIKDVADRIDSAETSRETARINARSRIDASMAAATSAAQSGREDSTAKMVAEYRIPFSQAVGSFGNSPTAIARKRQVLNDVLKLNPDFQEQNYNVYASTEKDASTGKIGTAANALNTMMGHLDVLNRAADALKGNNLQVLNRIANEFSLQTGQTPVSVYNTIVHRLGPEVTKAYLASGGSVGERGTNEQDFDAKQGPDQIKQNIGASALLADSKIKALQDQYNRGTFGRGKQKLISDEAEAARTRLTQQAPAILRGESSIPAGARVQKNTRTGQIRYSTDGGKTWQMVQ